MKKSIFYLFLFFCILSFPYCSSDDSSGEGEEKIDPNTIAADNLIFYVPFEGNAVDQIESLSPFTEINTGYVGGRKGKAFQGRKEGYLLYQIPELHRIRSLYNGFTISAWVKSYKITTESYPNILQLTNQNDTVWGNFLWYQKDLVSSKNFLWYVWQMNDRDSIYVVNGSRVDSINNRFIPDAWQHFIFTYDVSLAEFKVYQNGVPIRELNSYFTDVKFDFNTDELIIGAWLPLIKDTISEKWMGWFEGNLDELRIYDRALTVEETGLLYKAEESQAN